RPVEVFVYCVSPACQNYSDAAATVVTAVVEQGEVQHLIKHLDKTKQALLKGTVANIYLDYQQPEKTLEIIRELYQTQNQWKVDFSTIEAKMKQAFNLSPHKEADERSLAIHEEAFERGIKGIPTVFINDNPFEFNPLDDDQETIEAKLNKQIK